MRGGVACLDASDSVGQARGNNAASSDHTAFDARVSFSQVNRKVQGRLFCISDAYRLSYAAQTW